MAGGPAAAGRPDLTAHIINHTHWDREWFLTAPYTRRWLPGLIDRLAQLVAANPDFRFLLDGQTLVIADLLQAAPHYAARARRLIRGGHLIVGPYYCQPDWQLTGGELLLRNLRYGLADVRAYGGAASTGWLVDTFGHIRQAPQIHRLFGLEAVYVWRGVPVLAPYFTWAAPDGSRVLAINLFGGYRNLYGVTHAPAVAVRRLRAEVDKLRPYYPTPDVPLFDGYDLEDDPEDPIRFYAQAGGAGPGVRLQASTPAAFARHVAQQGVPLPVLAAELNSGKYGATFPGTLSARTYLKVMADDCQHLLFAVGEPLAALARLRGRAYPAAHFEAQGRALLQNAVHDAICGVSIDQVHERMEHSYRQVFDELVAEGRAALGAILADFAPGDYAVSTNPFPWRGWRLVGGALLQVETHGVGVWPVQARVSLPAGAEPLAAYAWQNAHYAASVTADGRVWVGPGAAGRLVAWRERGDAYTDEVGERLGELRVAGPLLLLHASPELAVLSYEAEWCQGARRATARVQVTFDTSPLIQWRLTLDTRGTDLRVEMEFATGLAGPVVAGMPFDLVPRPPADTDLLPRHLPADLASVLLGQRELGEVTTFAFHDVVAVSDGAATAAIFARGLHAYRADAAGTVRLTLCRAVEWLTRPDLQTRVGDAGPCFYVPDARGEREVEHAVALAVGRFAPEGPALPALAASFANPPLVVRAEGQGQQTAWPVFQAPLPLSSLTVEGERLLARLYNPTGQAVALGQAYPRTDVWGRPAGTVESVAPKTIVTLALPGRLPALHGRTAAVEWLTAPAWRVGPSRGAPDPAILASLATRAQALRAAIAEAERRRARSEGAAQWRWQHRVYVLQRECAEVELTVLLNRRKLERGGTSTRDDLDQPDPEIAALGLTLNRLRIKRRIFDYVVQAVD